MTNPISSATGTGKKEQKMGEYKYEVTTDILEDGKIEQYVEFVGPDERQRIMANVINTMDSQVKAALTLLGWTPPKANHISSANTRHEVESTRSNAEPYTLEQVEQKLSEHGWCFEDAEQAENITSGIRTLLNAAINELIGEPVAWMVESDDGEWHLGFDKQDLLREVLRVYTIQPLYAIKNSQGAMSGVTAKTCSEELP